MLFGFVLPGYEFDADLDEIEPAGEETASQDGAYATPPAQPVDDSDAD